MATNAKSTEPTKASKRKPVDKDEIVSVPLAWVGVDDVPVRAINQAYSQFDPDGLFVLTVGIANPPPLTGGKKANKELLQSLSAVKVTPVARLAMTEAHAESVMKALQKNVKQYRARKKAEGK